MLRQNVELDQLDKEIDTGETTLQQLLQVYKETYPDVRDLKRRLEVRKKTAGRPPGETGGDARDRVARPKEATKKGTNFQVAQSLTTLRGEIDKTNGLLKGNDTERTYRTKDQERITRQIEEYRNNCSDIGHRIPLRDLQRDQANATKRYQTAGQTGN